MSASTRSDRVLRSATRSRGGASTTAVPVLATPHIHPTTASPPSPSLDLVSAVCSATSKATKPAALLVDVTAPSLPLLISCSGCGREYRRRGYAPLPLPLSARQCEVICTYWSLHGALQSDLNGAVLCKTCTHKLNAAQMPPLLQAPSVVRSTFPSSSPPPPPSSSPSSSSSASPHFLSSVSYKYFQPVDVSLYPCDPFAAPASPIDAASDPFAFVPPPIKSCLKRRLIAVSSRRMPPLRRLRISLPSSEGPSSSSSPSSLIVSALRWEDDHAPNADTNYLLSAIELEQWKRKRKRSINSCVSNIPEGMREWRCKGCTSRLITESSSEVEEVLSKHLATGAMTNIVAAESASDSRRGSHSKEISVCNEYIGPLYTCAAPQCTWKLDHGYMYGERCSKRAIQAFIQAHEQQLPLSHVSRSSASPSPHRVLCADVAKLDSILRSRVHDWMGEYQTRSAPALLPSTNIYCKRVRAAPIGSRANVNVARNGMERGWQLVQIANAGAGTMVKGGRNKQIRTSASSGVDRLLQALKIV